MGTEETQVSLLQQSADDSGELQSSSLQNGTTPKACCSSHEHCAQDKMKGKDCCNAHSVDFAKSKTVDACASGACRRSRLARMRQLAEIREQKKWHRGDFNSLYSSSAKHDGSGGMTTAIPVIVWGCLPCITMFAPFLGHAGLLRSDGALLDFSLSYVVNLDAPAFGKPIRLISLESFLKGGDAGNSIGYEKLDRKAFKLETSSDVENDNNESYVYSWDRVLSEAVREYQNEQYDFFTNNCHTFVAHCLNKARIPGPLGLPWNMVTVAGVIFLQSRFVTMMSFITRLGLTSLVAAAGFLIFGKVFFFWWAVVLGAIVAYFLAFSFLYQWRP